MNVLVQLIHPVTAVCLLIASAVLSPLISRARKTAGIINLILTTAAAAVVLTLCYQAVFTGPIAPYEYHLFGVRYVFLIDGLSALFLALVAGMSVMSALYSIRYMDHFKDYKLAGYYIAFPLFVLGMMGILTVDDLSMGFSISWQLMTVASYALIRFEHRVPGNVRNANKYLILMELAWVLIITGTLFVNGIAIGDTLHDITMKMAAMKPAALFAVFGFILVGFSFKAGVFPFGQLWLPDAHSIAPSPVSAMLSGVMIKTGVYGILRTFFWMTPEGFNGTIWGVIIASAGAVTLFVGTAQAMKQNDSKRLLAYSSIGQVGYIILAVGSALFMMYSSSPFVKALALISIIGALYHVINHAVFKGLLFLSSGSVLYATGTKDLNKLGGLMALMPVTATLAAVASLAISGVPPLSGFASKWTIVASSLLAGSTVPWLALFGIVALFTSALTLACYVKLFGMTFAASGVQWNVPHPVKEVPFSMLLPKLLLALVCIVQGLFPIAFYKLIAAVFRASESSSLESLFAASAFGEQIVNRKTGVSLMIPGIGANIVATALPLMILAVIAGAFILAALLKRSGGAKEQKTEPWLCGYQDHKNSNRYTSTHMFSALKKLLWWTGGNVKQ
ncbi:MAG: hypothetical protein HZC28_06190 [Spirochaetes bacterium]|nr:hypothetical protein [Spirochaetota bacterium]